ncbi:TolC family protein [Natronospora cellulosivora (SeqCode)]
MDKRISILAFVLVLILSAISISAAELSFEQLINMGLDNNQDVQEKRDAIRDLERERNILKSSLDWHFGFDGDISHNTEGPSFNSPIIRPESTDVDLSLSANKTTLSGLTISSGLLLSDERPFEYRDIKDNYSFRLNLSKRLYPFLPTETEKGFIQIDNQFITAEEELEKIKKEKEIDWLEQYLSLISMEKSQGNLKLRYHLAQENLSNVLAQKVLGEAGQEQVLLAEIAVKEAEIQVEQMRITHAQAKRSFARELGIDSKLLSFNKQDPHLDTLASRAKEIEIELSDEDIENLLVENSYQLKDLAMNIEFVEKEIEWQKKEDGIKLDGSAGYNYNSGATDKSSVNFSLGVSYDFYDGGRKNLNIEGMENRLINLERQYDNTLDQLKIQVNSLQEQYRVNTMKLKTRELSLQKAELEELLYQRQLEQGAITESQYQEMSLQLIQAKLDLEQIKDGLLIDKLRIALALGIL